MRCTMNDFEYIVTYFGISAHRSWGTTWASDMHRSIMAGTVIDYWIHKGAIKLLRYAAKGTLD